MNFESVSQNGDSDSLERLNDLVEEFRAANASGNSVTFAEFVANHAEFCDELTQLLPLADILTHLGDDPTTFSSSAIGDFQSPHGALGDFRLVEEIGRGGMGIVYEAEQISLGRRVAVKVFPFATLLDARQLERFQTESRTAAMLQHPGIVNVLSVGCERGIHYYAMELISGQSLAAVIDQVSIDSRHVHADPEKTLPGSSETQPIAALSTEYASNRSNYFRQVAQLGVQVAQALQYAHAQGVLHRDVKPSNLLLDQTGKVLITDFGLARIGDGGQLTATGDMVGTLRYMSPEQIESNQLVDFRADIYALGATLYELLTGQPMFLTTDRTKLLKQIVDGQPTALRKRDPSIPRDLETIVYKCIAKSISDRYATAGDLADDLQRFYDHRPISATPVNTLKSITRWMRRNRKLSAVTTACACLTLLMAIVGPMLALHQTRLRNEQASLSRQLVIEKNSLELERKLREQQLYDSEIRHALAETEKGNFLRASAVMQAYELSDLTGFEFSLLQSRVDADRERTLAEHWCDIEQVAVSPDDKLIAFGTWDGTVVVLESQSKEEVQRFRLRRAKRCWIEAVEFSPDGRFLFCAGANVLQLRRVADWSVVPIAAPRPDEATIRVVRSAAFVVLDEGHKQRTLLAVGDRSGFNVGSDPAHLLLYQIDDSNGFEELRAVAALKGNRGSVNDIAFHAGTNVLLACGRDLFVRRWQLPAGDAMEPIDLNSLAIDQDSFEMLSQIELHPQDPDLLYFSATERTAEQTTSRIGSVRMSDGAMKLLATRESGCESLAVSTNGKILAAGFDDGEVRLFDRLVDYGDLPSLPATHVVAHHSTVHDMQFDQSGQRFFTASADRTLKRWSLERLPKRSGASQSVIPELSFTTALEWLSDGRRIVSAQGTDTPMLKLWDRSTGKLLRKCAVPDSLFVTDLCVISDSQIAFVAYAWPNSTGNARVGIWDTITNDVETLQETMGTSSHVAVSHDASKLLAALGNEIVVIDVPSLKIDYRHAMSKGSALAVHPSRDLCAFHDITATHNEAQSKVLQKRKRIVIWDFARRRIVGSLVCDHLVASLAFSPDGKKLAAGTFNPILLWPDWEAAARADDQPPQVIAGHGMHVWDIEFTADNRRIASAALDRSVRLWNATTGNELMHIRTEAAWNYAVAFSPDGNSLAYAGGLGSPFGAIHFIDAKKGAASENQEP